MQSFLDVSYGPDPAHRLDVFLPAHSATEGSTSSASKSSKLKPLFVFIHGGAWRSEDIADHRSTIIQALMSRLGLPIASINYRLSPQVRHPEHAADVVSALTFLKSWKNDAYDIGKMVLAGHSCGGFIAACLALEPNPPSTSRLNVPKDLRDSIRGVACLEPIADLPMLVAEYPQYRNFVEEAFGPDETNWSNESPARWVLSQQSNGPVSFLIIHSREDELLSFEQPKLLAENLVKALNPPPRTKTLAQPQIVEQNGGQAPDHIVKGSRGSVEVDFDSVHGSHMASLNSAAMADLLETWVRKSFASECD